MFYIERSLQNTFSFHSFNRIHAVADKDATMGGGARQGGGDATMGGGVGWGGRQGQAYPATFRYIFLKLTYYIKFRLRKDCLSHNLTVFTG